MHKDIDLDRVRQRLTELAAMADEPALMAGLERVIKRLASTSSGEEVRRSHAANVAASARRSPAAGSSTVDGESPLQFLRAS
jgi:hypothetical protein